MAANALERAVIDAARSFIAQVDVPCGYGPLMDAVDALDAHLATQQPSTTERGWHEVAEGDHLLSAKTGRFYRVLRTLKVAKGYEITVLVGEVEKVIVRPSAAEPTATVRRGPTGDAVDVLTHVFSSGPKR